MERRVLDWLFALGAWSITAALFLFASLVIALIPMTDNEMSVAFRGVIAALAILHIFMVRHKSVMRILDCLLALLSVIALYVLFAGTFAEVCHVLTGAAMDNAWLRIAAQFTSAAYVSAGVHLLRLYGGGDISLLKAILLSWLMTPFLAHRLLARRERMRWEEFT